jgi:hypothetical protein
MHSAFLLAGWCVLFQAGEPNPVVLPRTSKISLMTNFSPLNRPPSGDSGDDATTFGSASSSSETNAPSSSALDALRVFVRAFSLLDRRPRRARFLTITLTTMAAIADASFGSGDIENGATLWRWNFVIHLEQTVSGCKPHLGPRWDVKLIEGIQPWTNQVVDQS